jgi:hypothetical protein
MVLHYFGVTNFLGVTAFFLGVTAFGIVGTDCCEAVAKGTSALLPRHRMSAAPSRSIAEQKTQSFTPKRRFNDE